jgi:predicted class III extradiol MEMO1 family dioxygenase
MSVREASHAGSWYTSNKSQLSQQLDAWLAAVPNSTLPIGTESSKAGEVSIPAPGARAIIAPYAS